MSDIEIIEINTLQKVFLSVSNNEIVKAPNAIASTPGPKVLLFSKEFFDDVDDNDKVLYEELLKCAKLKAQIKRRMAKVTDSVKVKNTQDDEVDKLKKGKNENVLRS